MNQNKMPISKTGKMTEIPWLSSLNQILRIRNESERHGVDMVEFKGPAYSNDLKSRTTNMFNDVRNPSPVIMKRETITSMTVVEE